MDVGAIIALVISSVGLVVAILTFLYSRHNDKFYRSIESARREEEIERKKKENKLHRPQLKATHFEFDFDKVGYKEETEYDFDLFFLPYKELDVDLDNFTPLYETKIKKNFRGYIETTSNTSKFISQGKHTLKRPICTYQDVYDKKDEWISWKIHLKNIGKSNIVFYYLLSTMEKSGSLIDNKSKTLYSLLTMNKSCEFKATTDKNLILVDEEIKIKISFHKDFIASNLFSANFALHMETEDGGFWAQGLSYGAKETGISYEIPYKEFSDYYKGDYLDAVMYDRIYWDKVRQERRERENTTNQIKTND